MGKVARQRRGRKSRSTPPYQTAKQKIHRSVTAPRIRPSVLALVFGVALVVRLIHVWQLEASPFGDLLLGDSAGYDRWAKRIAAGDWVGSEVFYQAPLYPYFLGVIYTLFGETVSVVRICQAVVGASSCVLLAGAGARFFSPRIGMLSGFVLALYAPAIFMDATLQKSVLDLLLLSGLLYVLGRLPESSSTTKTLVSAGVLLGALSLTRENALVLVVALVAWFVLEREQWLRRTTVVVAGVLIVLVPVAVRNGVVGGEWHLTTSQFGPNFYIGNHADADGTYQPLRYGRGDPLFERDDATALAEAALGRELSPARVSQYWVDRALSDISAEPGQWLRLVARKAALTFNAVEVVDTESQYAHADHSFPLVMTGWVTHFGVLLPLALVGIAATLGQRRRLMPLYLMLAMYAVSVIGFYVFARYRYPLVPLVLLFAVAGGDALVQLVRRKIVLSGAPVVLFLAVVVSIGANWPLVSKPEMRSVSYNNLGTAYRERGNLASAVDLYETSVELTPDYANAHSNLASALTASGMSDRALEHYQVAIDLDPSVGDVYFNYGNALLAEGRFDDAVGFFERALEDWPNDAEAYNNLGMALGSMNRLREAADAFAEAVRLDPRAVLAHQNLAIMLDALGDRAGALRHRQEAERLEQGGTSGVR